MAAERKPLKVAASHVRRGQYGGYDISLAVSFINMNTLICGVSAHVRANREVVYSLRSFLKILIPFHKEKEEIESRYKILREHDIVPEQKDDGLNYYLGKYVDREKVEEVMRFLTQKEVRDYTVFLKDAIIYDIDLMVLAFSENAHFESLKYALTHATKVEEITSSLKNHVPFLPKHHKDLFPIDAYPKLKELQEALNSFFPTPKKVIRRKRSR